MGYLFGGSDRIDSANDAVTGIDVDSFSWSGWIKFTTLPVAGSPQQILTHASTLSPGNHRRSLVAEVVSGTVRLSFYQTFSGVTFANWVSSAAAFTSTG